MGDHPLQGFLFDDIFEGKDWKQDLDTAQSFLKMAIDQSNYDKLGVACLHFAAGYFKADIEHIKHQFENGLKLCAKLNEEGF